MNKYVTNLTLPNGTNVLIKDSECRTNLSNEINRATKKETWLQNNIDTVESAREDGEHRLHQLIINESNRATKKEESLQNLIESINNAQHPIGSIYMSISSTSPASLFGGTWEQINDKFLLSAGSTYRAGSTGGEATHKLTISEMPSHAHKPHEWTVITSKNDSTGRFNMLYKEPYDAKFNQFRDDEDQDRFGSYVGGDIPHNNMPPYLTVYMWKRIS